MSKHLKHLFCFFNRVLESEEGRKGYLVYPTSKNHSSSQKGRKASLKGNGRRIDYMLYTEEGLYLEWKVVSPRVDAENQNLQTN